MNLPRRLTTACLLLASCGGTTPAGNAPVDSDTISHHEASESLLLGELTLTGELQLDVELDAPDGSLSQASGSVSWSCTRCTLAAPAGSGVPELALGSLQLNAHFAGGTGTAVATSTAPGVFQLIAAGQIQLADEPRASQLTLQGTIALGPDATTDDAMNAGPMVGMMAIIPTMFRVTGTVAEPRVTKLAVGPRAATQEPIAHPRLPDTTRPIAEPVPEELANKVRIVAGTTIIVPKALRDWVFENPKRATTGARFVPAIRNGNPDGFKLYAIRPGSIFALFGLRNGDTLHAIAGSRLTGPDTLMKTVAELANADEFTVELSRRAELITLTYKLVD